jgi:hypothetical protein
MFVSGGSSKTFVSGGSSKMFVLSERFKMFVSGGESFEDFALQYSR